MAGVVEHEGEVAAAGEDGVEAPRWVVAAAVEAGVLLGGEDPWGLVDPHLRKTSGSAVGGGVGREEGRSKGRGIGQGGADAGC